MITDNVRHKTGNFTDTSVSKNYHCTARITQNSGSLCLCTPARGHRHVGPLLSWAWAASSTAPCFLACRPLFPATSIACPPVLPPSLSSHLLSHLLVTWAPDHLYHCREHNMAAASDLPVPLKLPTPVVSEARPKCGCAV